MVQSVLKWRQDLRLSISGRMENGWFSICISQHQIWNRWNPQSEIIKNVIAEPFVQKYMEFFDIQTMAARLHNKESMSSEFKLKEGL